MPSPERELPFAYPLSDIISEMLDVDPDSPSLSNNANRLVQTATTRPARNAREVVEHLTGDSEFSPRVFAFALTQKNIFTNWDERDKRFLLSCALGDEITAARGRLEELSSIDPLYGLTDLERSEIAFSRETIARAQKRKAKLSERAAPSPASQRR